MTAKTSRLLCAALAMTGAGLLTACGSSAKATDAAQAAPSQAAVSTQAAPKATPSISQPDDFCAGVRRLGLEQNTSAAQASPSLDAQLLPKLDALLSIAPPDISSDFALFVKVEHAVLGGGGDPADQQELDNAQTASRLAHVSSYLQEHCGVG